MCTSGSKKHRSKAGKLKREGEHVVCNEATSEGTRERGRDTSPSQEETRVELLRSVTCPEVASK